MVIEPQHVIGPLRATFSGLTKEEREAAEKQLNQFALVDGFGIALLKIITANEVEAPTKQAAAISLKRLSRNHWAPLEDEDVGEVAVVVSNSNTKYLTEQEKQVLKENIVEALIHSDSKVRSQLGLTFRNMLDCEYPKKWPELLPKLLGYLGSQDLKLTYGALYAVRMLLRKYEYITNQKKRQPMFELVHNVFPALLSLFTVLSENSSLPSAEMQLLITKSFYSATNYGIPPTLRDPTTMLSWMNLLLKLLEKPVPTENEPQDPDERKNWPWWKAKKWVSQIFSRLFVRYGDPKTCDTPDAKQFCKQFLSTYAPKLLESFMKLLGTRRNGGYLPDRTTYYALQYIDTAVHNNTIYKLLKPHALGLFQEIIFPLLCFNEADYELWNDDPHEYLRKEFDLMEDCYSPRSAGTNVVVDLARLRGKNHLNDLMTFVGQILMKYQNAPDQQKNPKEKDGALLIFGSVCDKLMKTPEYAPQLEHIIVNFVIPDFSSPVPFLRSRACWVFNQYFELDYKNAESYLMGLRATLNCLHDQELPVKIRAALSLRFLIQNDLSRDEIRKIIPQILDIFFKLMNEIDNDELISTLEAIIEHYADDMAPYALTLCTKLSEAFLRIASTEMDEDDSVLTAMECLGAIQTILNSVHHLPQLYPELERELLPLLHVLMHPDQADFFEEGIKIVSFITYFSKNISQEMWKLFPALTRAFVEWGPDFLNDLLPPLDNFISYGTETFLSGNHLELVSKIYQDVMTNDDMSETYIRDACDLVEIIILNCRGRIDNWIDPYLQIAMNVLSHRPKLKPVTKVYLIEVFVNALYYNPVVTLNIMQARGWTPVIFSSWFQLLPNMTRTKDKKITILALCSLLSLPAESLPDVVKGGYKQIVETIVKMSFELMKLKESIAAEAAKMAEEEDEDDDADYADHELNEFEDEDGLDINELAKQAASQYSDEADGDSEEDDLNDAMMEEEEVESPLDKISELIVVSDHMKALAARDPNMYQSIVNNPELNKQFHEVIQKAEHERLNPTTKA